MEGDTMTTMLALFAGLFCLLAAGLLFGLAVYQMRRNQRVEPPKPGRPLVPAGVRGTPPPKASPLPGGPDGAYDEEEAPTVVVNQPGLGQGGRGPAQVSPNPAPGGRSSGATIIAFDDDDDD